MGDHGVFAVRFLASRPKWMDDVVEAEANDIFTEAEIHARRAFADSIDARGRKIAERKAAEAIGQMDIFAYV